MDIARKRTRETGDVDAHGPFVQLAERDGRLLGRRRRVCGDDVPALLPGAELGDGWRRGVFFQDEVDFEGAADGGLDVAEVEVVEAADFFGFGAGLVGRCVFVEEQGVAFGVDFEGD